MHVSDFDNTSLLLVLCTSQYKTSLNIFFSFLSVDIHLTEYRNVKVVIWTHVVGGLTSSDFKLAKAIENTKIDLSPKWLTSHPEFAKFKKL